MIEYEAGALRLVRAQVRRNLSEQVQRLAIRDGVGVPGRMPGRRGFLACDLADTDRPAHPLEQRKFRTADRDSQLTALSAMQACQRNRAFAVDESGEVRRIERRQRRSSTRVHGNMNTRFGRRSRKVSPRPNGRGRDWWRRRDSCSTAFAAGWTMPSPRLAPGAGRLIRHLSDPGHCPGLRLGSSMSLYRAGLELASFLPLGVTACRRFRRRQASPM
jgi:hypothetical protein